jgi:hypothetical protein
MPIRSTVRVQVSALDDPCFKITKKDIKIYKKRIQKRIEKLIENYKNIKESKDKDVCYFEIHKGDFVNGCVKGDEKEFIKKLCKGVKIALALYFISCEFYYMEIYEYNPLDKSVTLLKKLGDDGSITEIGFGGYNIDYNKGLELPHEITEAFYEQDYFESKEWKNFFDYWDYPAHIEKGVL